LRNSQGKIVDQHKFFEDYAHRDGFFAKIRAVGPAKDELFPEPTMWVGGKYLPEGKNKDMFSVALLRSGELVAHSKRTTGFISTGHFEAKHIKFYHPHEQKEEVNAELFMLTDLQAEGEYEVSVTRQSD
jgi:hypothetical protein